MVVASSFFGGDRAHWAADGGMGTCLSASKNKGSLAMLFFEHQGLDLLHVGLHYLYLAAGEFWSSSQRFP
jgi:hypothetical protein